MTKKLRLVTLAVLCFGLLLSPAAHGDTYTIRATSTNSWNPDFRHITKGNRIRWRNPSTNFSDHVVKSYGNNWSKNVRLDPGEATRKRFRRTGAFKYRCTIHSTLSGGNCNGMCGVVHVTN